MSERCDATIKDALGRSFCREINGYLITEGADLRGADLAGADLSGLNIPRIDWRGANLEGATFRGSVQEDGFPSADSLISGSRFDYANCVRVAFPSPNLMARCSFGATDLRRATMERVAVEFTTTMRKARLNRLAYANDNTRGSTEICGRIGTPGYLPWEEIRTCAPGDKSITIHRPDLWTHAPMLIQGPLDARLAVWRRNHAIKIYFGPSKMARIRMRKSRFEHCDFSGADLRGAYLVRCYFLNCSFRGANLARAKQRGCVFELCDFLGANLEGSDLHLSPSAGSDAALEIGA